MAKPAPTTAPVIEWNRDDDVRHGHSTVIRFGEGQRRVLTWWDDDGCARPVTIAAFQMLKGPLPAGIVPALAALKPQTDIPADLRLAVAWGSGGVQAHALLDLGRSTCFTIVAAKIELSAIYLGMGDLDPLAVALPPVQVFADAGEAIPGTLPVPRLTEKVGLAVAAGPPGVNIVVPAYAFEVRPSVPYPPGPGQVELEQLNATGAVLWRSEFGDDAPERRMVLDGFCRVVNFQHSFAAPIRASLVFGLAL